VCVCGLPGDVYRDLGAAARAFRLAEQEEKTWQHKKSNLTKTELLGIERKCSAFLHVRENDWSYTGEWSGNFELTVLAIHWQRPIIVFETDNGTCSVHSPHLKQAEEGCVANEENLRRLGQRVDFLDLSRYEEPIYVLYKLNNHFNALVPRTADQPPAQLPANLSKQRFWAQEEEEYM